MITYRKNSLKVHNIYASDNWCGSVYYTHRIAEGIKHFIEKGEYKRIAHIKIYGESNSSLICTIIYEEGKDSK